MISQEALNLIVALAVMFMLGAGLSRAAVTIKDAELIRDLQFDNALKDAQIKCLMRWEFAAQEYIPADKLKEYMSHTLEADLKAAGRDIKERTGHK